MPQTIQSILTHDKAALETALNLDAAGARIEAQMLLQRVLGVSRTYLLTHPEQELDKTQSTNYHALLQRRLNGEPVAHILGEREFYGLNLAVSPATLIPRPDTELLVELALQYIPRRPPSPHPSPEGRGSNYRVLDMGTGSGAIALSVAHARPDAEVTAVDASREALEVAKKNMQQLNIHNTRLLHSDWFSALSGERFDLIVSNPPYIAAGDIHLTQGDLRFEPHSALASGADGLDDIRCIVAQARTHLNKGGWLLFEHGYDQAERVRALLEQAGFSEIFSARDLAGIERVTGGRSN